MRKKIVFLTLLSIITFSALLHYKNSNSLVLKLNKNGSFKITKAMEKLLTKQELAEFSNRDFESAKEFLAEKHHKKEIYDAEMKVLKSAIRSIKKTKTIIPVIERHVFVEILKKGDGEYTPYLGNVILKIKSLNENNELEEAHEASSFNLSKLPLGIQIGIANSKVGEIRKIYFHPKYSFDPESIKLSAYEIQYLGKEAK